MNLLDQNIYPNIGNSQIIVGKHISSIKEILNSNLEIEVNINPIKFKNKIIYIDIEKSISIGIDLFTGIIYHVNFSNKYAGKILGKIGIGDSIPNLIKLFQTIFIEDDLILIGKRKAPIDCILKINNEAKFIESLDSVKNNLITEIIIENPYLLSDYLFEET